MTSNHFVESSSICLPITSRVHRKWLLCSVTSRTPRENLERSSMLGDLHPTCTSSFRDLFTMKRSRSSNDPFSSHPSSSVNSSVRSSARSSACSSIRLILVFLFSIVCVECHQFVNHLIKSPIGKLFGGKPSGHRFLREVKVTREGNVCFSEENVRQIARKSVHKSL